MMAAGAHDARAVTLAERGSVTEQAAAVRAGTVRARDLTEAYLDRIAHHDATVGAYLLVNADGARAQADAVDASLAAGRAPGPLAGVPIGIKDVFCTRGLETTAASRILRGFIPPYESTVTTRLLQAGAVPLGKLNMDEFAMGSSNENSAIKPVRNPWDTGRVPGGSSGGSAAAVAAGLCTASLGTDTGGSIRQPAALCGVTGMKPTYGRISRWGVIAFASSLDHPGPLGHDVEDTAALLEVMAGPDDHDATSLAAPVGRYRAACQAGRSPGAVQDLRIGVPAEYFQAGLDATVENAVRTALDMLGRAGARVVPISLPHTKYAIATYYVISTAEAASNLARYDGIRYGFRAAHVRTLEELYTRTRGQGFGREVKRRIMLGTYVLRAGYYDAFYGKALQVRRKISEDFAAAFTLCDVIATPTSPFCAFKLGEKLSDPMALYLADAYTVAPSLAGLPAIALPCGFAPGAATGASADLPIGLQLIAPTLGEEILFRTGAAYQHLTDWHLCRPAGFFSVPAVTRPETEASA